MEKESKKSYVYLDIAVILLTILCCLVVIFTFELYKKETVKGYSELEVITSLEEKQYGDAIKQAYFNELVMRKPTEGMLECEAVADFIEASYLLPVYKDKEDTKKIENLEKRIENDKEAMGKLDLDWIRVHH